jgi:hypothetical protein
LTTQIEKHFQFVPEWYRGGKVTALVLEYYVLLRSVLRTRPFLRRCLVRCRHCRIFFLTHPGNGGRKDLGCPFGCQEAHRRRQSTIRSVAYYSDAKGKEKKQKLNRKRNRQNTGQPPPSLPPVRVPGPVPESEFRPPHPLLLEYVRMVVSLIEARPVSRKEVLEMLQKIWRQHTLPRRRNIDHTVAWLHENPP